MTVELSAPPRLHSAGARAVLFDPSATVFSSSIQQRLFALVDLLSRLDGVEQTVPGMNNLLVVFNPLEIRQERLSAWLVEQWSGDLSVSIQGREFEVPVVYGGAETDLSEICEQLSISTDEFVDRHANGTYSVACIGAMPGFPYLSGLDPAIAVPRRAVPRMRLERGAVIVGGAQAGIMPCAAPSGWHIIGHTELELFDSNRSPAVLLRPGDIIRFKVLEVLR
ncbi:MULTISPECIES: 5-oxoprolinase subunit PxpB [Pseudomonas]|uniref:5-oxoprolinase subunit PxpB n=1 Tax=Pseudomonas TaxID=286 RepID=UPI000A9002C6|nr:MULTISPECIES: 5-oxoprolinase subunit PxpB [Pseudomonas]